MQDFQTIDVEQLQYVAGGDGGGNDLMQKISGWLGLGSQGIGVAQQFVDLLKNIMSMFPQQQTMTADASQPAAGGAPDAAGAAATPTAGAAAAPQASAAAPMRGRPTRTA